MRRANERPEPFDAVDLAGQGPAIPGFWYPAWVDPFGPLPYTFIKRKFSSTIWNQEIDERDRR